MRLKKEIVFLSLTGGWLPKEPFPQTRTLLSKIKINE